MVDLTAIFNQDFTNVMEEASASSSLRTSEERDDKDLPSEAKRRRLNIDTPSTVSSRSMSPCQGDVTLDDTLLDTPTDSPSGSLTRDYKQHYRKDALWKAIESDYQYLMDGEIIDTCRVSFISLFDL